MDNLGTIEPMETGVVIGWDSESHEIFMNIEMQIMDRDNCNLVTNGRFFFDDDNVISAVVHKNKFARILNVSNKSYEYSSQFYL